MSEIIEDIPPEITKLTDWVSEPSVADLKQNLDDATNDQDSHLQDVKRWLSNLYIKDAAKPKKIEGQSSVAPKVIRRQAEWRYSGLSEPFLSTPDIFNVGPTTAGDVKRARQNALILNNQFNNQLEKVAFIDEYVRDMVDIGTVLVKVGWDTEETEVTKNVPQYEYTPSLAPEQIQQYVGLLQLRKTDADLYAENSTPGLDHALEIFATTGQVLIPKKIGSEEITTMEETKNQPTVEICIAENMLIDPTCNGNIKKATFIGEKWKSSLSDLKKDGRYKNLDYIMVGSSDPNTDPDYEATKDAGNFTFQDKPRKQFVVHSYWGDWDIDNTGITKPIHAVWVGRVMILLEDNPFPDRSHPYIKAVYMPVRKSIFGEPDGELLEENQDIIGACTRGMIDLLGKSANGQTGFKKNLLDTANKRRFRRGDDYEFNSNDDPRQGIFTHKYPEIPQSAFNLIGMQNSDAESLSGVKAFSSGINGEAIGANVGNGRSALDAASKRETAILRRAAAGIIEIGRKFISMNAEWLSPEETVRITNEEFIQIRRDDLAGKFDLQLSISTPEADEAKAKELAFMLQTNGPNSDPGEVRMIRAEIARLRKMPDLAKKIEEYEPKPDPLAVKKAQLEIKLLEAQIEKELSLVVKHNSTSDLDDIKGARELSQTDLNTAKEKTEYAKARNLESDSDQKDLNFVETESGVTQERDLQREREKSKKKTAA